jgi:hypothetical protein
MIGEVAYLNREIIQIANELRSVRERDALAALVDHQDVPYFVPPDCGHKCFLRVKMVECQVCKRMRLVLHSPNDRH